MEATAHQKEDGTKRPTVLPLLRPAAMLRAEGAAVLALSLVLYWMNGGSWVMFALLLFAPDLSMLGYVAGPRVGAAVYNTFQTYPLPAALAAFGLVGGSTLAIAVSLIWLGHIGMDRALGYGLKYPTAFKDTHLERI